MEKSNLKKYLIRVAVIVAGIIAVGSNTSTIAESELWINLTSDLVDVETVKASSRLNDFKNKTYSTENLIDKNPVTVWSSSKDFTEEDFEWIKFELSDESQISRMEIKNGYWESEDQYMNNNRVKKIEVIFDDKYVETKELEDNYDETNFIKFDKKITAKSIKIKIIDIYKGNGPDNNRHTCISEIEFYK